MDLIHLFFFFFLDFLRIFFLDLFEICIKEGKVRISNVTNLVCFFEFVFNGLIKNFKDVVFLFQKCLGTISLEPLFVTKVNYAIPLLVLGANRPFRAGQDGINSFLITFYYAMYLYINSLTLKWSSFFCYTQNLTHCSLIVVVSQYSCLQNWEPYTQYLCGFH